MTCGAGSRHGPIGGAGTVGELRDCRQLSEDHWQGIDVDGAILDVRGGLVPEHLLAVRGCTAVGLIRLIRA